MKPLKATLILISLYTTVLISQTQLAFGIKPGIQTNSAYLGIKQNAFLPFIGIDLLQVSTEGDYTYTSLHNHTSEFWDKTLESIEFSGKALLIVPQIGMKYFFSKKEIRSYTFGALFIGLPVVDISGQGTYETWENGQLIEYQSDVTITDLDALEEMVSDILGFWGVHVGGGAEYFFHPNFSIGAEYGLKLISDSAKMNRMSTDMDEDSVTGFQNTWTADVSASMKV